MNVAVNDKVIIRVGSHTYSGQVLHIIEPTDRFPSHLILLDDNQLIANSPSAPASIKAYRPGFTNLATIVHRPTVRTRLRHILDKTEDMKYLVWVPVFEILSVYESDLTLKEIVNQLDEEVL